MNTWDSSAGRCHLGAEKRTLMAVVDDRPRLRSDVELVSGFDGESLLHVAPDGRYVRLGSAAAELVPYFDGTRSVHDIALGVVGDRDISAQDVEVALQRLVESLARAGFLDGVPRASNPSLRSWFSRTPTKRFPLLSADSVARFIRPATALVDVLRPPAMIILIACLAVVISGASVGVLAVRYMTIRTTWVPFVMGALCLTCPMPLGHCGSRGLARGRLPRFGASSTELGVSAVVLFYSDRIRRPDRHVPGPQSGNSCCH